MSTPKQYFQSAKHLFHSVRRLGRAVVKGLVNWLLRVLMRLWGNPSRLTQQGFVLPTVVMVMLVVTLLTTAIVFRSFDRAKNASNFRVNQAVLNAATPAIDRSTAKLQQLFSDPNLPRGTPNDETLEGVLVDNINTYTFGDEKQIKLTYKDVDGDGNDEELRTAWRIPVDTDNNGKFDSFTLYGIFFKNPPIASSGAPERKRIPLEARTPPMDETETNPDCAAAGTSASLVGNKGWYSIGGKLKKAFFTYVATVPITNKDNLDDIAGNINSYENYKGNKGFSALEYQLDREQIPLSNNAILYEDDVEMASGPKFRINGRIFTNSNLLVKELDNPTEFFQVSSRHSCFYNAENSKIVVGGNFGYGVTRDEESPPDNDGNKPIETHLFQGTKDGNDPATKDEDNDVSSLRADNKSVNHASAEIAYNNEAYNRRIKHLVDAAEASSPLGLTGTPPDASFDASNKDPQDVKDKTLSRINNPTNLLTSLDDQEEARRESLEIYFRNRTRRVPYAEVAYGVTETFTAADDPIKDAGNDDSLRPKDEWMFPFNPTNGMNESGFAGLALKTSGKTLLPKATAFEVQEEEGKERYIGDRVLLGNNLPALWYKDGQFVGRDEPQEIGTASQTEWNFPNGEGPRARKTQVRTLDELDTVSRDGFWENAAAENPEELLDGVGGLRIVTGAGIYLPPDDLLSPPAPAQPPSNVVWPDTMPVIPPHADPSNPPSWGAFPMDENNQPRPYLKMRATAVYHYTKDEGRTPIACVATYYDPTNQYTVRNRQDMALADLSYDWVGETPHSSPPPPPNKSTLGNYADGPNSINGITFRPPNVDVTDATIRNYLDYQANLVYPNGRRVNQLLRDALADIDNGDTPTLAKQAAIDSTICALQIYGQLHKSFTSPLDSLGIGGKLETLPGGYKLPWGTITETAFLDARQVKSIDQDYNPEDNPDSSSSTDPNYLPPRAVTANPSPTAAAGAHSLTSRYNLPIEERYPLEIRATVIDLDKLRGETATSLFSNSFDEKEYMFPNSGIIYATRDDALPDASDADANISATDFKLDPTRRPNGIMLINGSELGRRPGNKFAEVEKGLILASNLPVYVKGEFNPHKNASTGDEIGEFEGTQPTNDTQAPTFYSRSTLEKQFACRAGDARLPDCDVGDSWRAATIISDAVTILSSNFREGVRVDGDYDLRNNQIDNVAAPAGPPVVPLVDPVQSATTISTARSNNGFWRNNFVTNGLSSGREFAADSVKSGLPASDVTLTDAFYSGTGNPNVINSSYFNNFVTPIQRRVQFPEYVMEICRKLPVSDCQQDDWVVGYDILTGSGTKNANGDPTDDLEDSIHWTDVDGNPVTQLEADIKASDLAEVLADNSITFDDPTSFDPTQLGAGTTTRPALIEGDRRFARRVAFLRYTQGLATPINTSIGTVNNAAATVSGTSTENLVLHQESAGDPWTPVPLGISGTDDTGDANPDRGALSYFPRNRRLTIDGANYDPYDNLDRPRLRGNTLLYQTKDRNNYGYEHSLAYTNTLTENPANPEQPILVPVPQIQYTTATSAQNKGALGVPGNNTPDTKNAETQTNWLPIAASGITISNAAFATGDVPSRPSFTDTDASLTPTAFSHDGDFNGGVPNIIRFLENWDGAGAKSQVNGSFIQIKRSNYATSPYAPLPTNKSGATTGAPFNHKQIYSIQNTGGQVPYFAPPERQWGFDVGLLSQLPDLFAQQFTSEPVTEPNEFFREVNRDDPWVKRLLCAKDDNGNWMINESERPHNCQ